MVDKLRLLTAVNLLSESPNCQNLIDEMNDMIARWEFRPLAYQGPYEVLNELVQLGVDDEAAYKRLLDLVAQKREIPREERRNLYQKNFMRAQRQRIAKAIQLQELQHGRLTPSQKKDFTKEVRGRWAAARERFLHQQGPLSYKQRHAAAHVFWEKIDANLDENIETLRRKKLERR